MSPVGCRRGSKARKYRTQPRHSRTSPPVAKKIKTIPASERTLRKGDGSRQLRLTWGVRGDAERRRRHPHGGPWERGLASLGGVFGSVALRLKGRPCGRGGSRCRR